MMFSLLLAICVVYTKKGNMRSGATIVRNLDNKFY